MKWLPGDLLHSRLTTSAVIVINCCLESCVSLLQASQTSPPGFACRNHHQGASSKRARDRKGLVCTQTNKARVFRGICNEALDRLSDFTSFLVEGRLLKKSGRRWFFCSNARKPLCFSERGLLFAIFPENGLSFPKRRI